MRILVVEDDPDLLSALVQSMREEGYAVDASSDGVEALRKAEGGPYDVLVLDLMLPRLDGRSIIKQLRKHGHDVPVLVLTALQSTADRVAGLDLGADDYLSKPFDLAELMARVRALVRRAAGKASPMIHMGDVMVDTAARMVWKEGQVVPLTPREYALVELLSLHRGKLVSRSMIYDHLFDEQDDSLSNLIEVHVSNVRKKLGKDFIDTRRGHGYVIHDGAKGALALPDWDEDA